MSDINPYWAELCAEQQTIDGIFDTELIVLDQNIEQTRNWFDL
jgi:hypothetical protein